MTTTDDKKPEQQLDYDAALWRLVYLSLGGCVVIVIYGAWSAHGLGVVGVGLMTAGAAMLSGGLLGFLFGVPHTREGEAAQAKVEEREEADGQQSKSVGGDSSPTYRPNTSLEQISDWLTKMLVGVGLIEIKVIPAKLKSIADYLAKGLGGTDQAQAFALTMLIYFSVCGFVFGFLWARLYLKKWFVESDRQEVKKLGEKLSRLEEKQLADAKAFALVFQQMNRDQDDSPAKDQDMVDAIKAASTPTRAQIFSHAEEASGNQKADNYSVKNETAICIFKALIASDTKGIYHRNHSELSYALRRKQPPDMQGAEAAIAKAIEIRDKLGKTGWKYYEFRRARYRIEQDPDFRAGRQSKPSLVEQIEPDLKAAYREADRWERWCREQPAVPEWMALNKINVSQLG
jgi:hypothetical protein